VSHSHQEKLQLALANARTVLGKEAPSRKPSHSKLNHLRGVDSINDTREGDLISRTGVKTRPIFDIVADAILGEGVPWKPSIDLESSDSSLAQIASKRIGEMRDKQVTEDLSEELLGDDLGILKDGRPIWAEVLDSQRGYAINSSDYNLKDLSFRPKWPPIQNMSDHNTWKSWHVVEENSRASLACEKVIDNPGSLMNPLLVLGASGCGKSHILSASVQAMIRRQDGNVHLLSVSAMRSWESLPDGWQDAVSHARLIAIDDLHLAEERIATELGLMIDYALNLGVQVIATSRVDSNEWQARRLWEVMRSSTSIWLKQPSSSSLITHLRRDTSGRSLLLDDSMLARIVTFGNGDWRSTDAAFEKVALAIESGERVVSGDDVTNILQDAPTMMTTQEVFTQREDLEDIASRVISETLDHVYTGTDIGGVELHTTLPTISDEWEVPELSFEEKDELHEVLTTENLIPHVTTTLTLDERDAFLVGSDTQTRGFDKVRVDETFEGISNITEQMFEKMGEEHLAKSNQLAELEQEMSTLAEMSQDASVDDLIQIADRVGEIELMLRDISGQGEFATLTPITVLTPQGEEE
jgi:chromosomal replication initiation ATPase DnaA